MPFLVEFLDGVGDPPQVICVTGDGDRALSAGFRYLLDMSDEWQAEASALDVAAGVEPDPGHLVALYRWDDGPERAERHGKPFFLGWARARALEARALELCNLAAAGVDSGNPVSVAALVDEAAGLRIEAALYLSERVAEIRGVFCEPGFGQVVLARAVVEYEKGGHDVAV